MKKVLSLLLAVCLLAALVGCNSYHAYKDTYTDPDSYRKLWSLAGFYRGEGDRSALFPQSLHGLEVEQFFCRYDQQLPLGEGVQFLIKVHYEDYTLFDAEVTRIAGLATLCNEAFNQPSLDAYGIRILEDNTSEYAFIDSNNLGIYYIYLQSLPKEEIEIDHNLLPTEYFGYGQVREEGVLYI